MTKILLPFISILFISYFAKGQQGTTIVIKPDSVYENVDVPASFKGGDAAWNKFLQRKLVYPSGAISGGIEGSVLVGFNVEIDGSVKDVKALSGPAELRDAAISVVKKSPYWIPAQKYGRNVKSYNNKLINFTLHVP
jgi:protein TonB